MLDKREILIRSQSGINPQSKNYLIFFLDRPIGPVGVAPMHRNHQLLLIIAKKESKKALVQTMSTGNCTLKKHLNLRKKETGKGGL